MVKEKQKIELQPFSRPDWWCRGGSRKGLYYLAPSRRSRSPLRYFLRIWQRMRHYKNIGYLFEEEPKQWGLRGDPFLWREMREYFSEAPIPNSFSELEQKIEQAFFDLTGHPMSSSKHFRIERLARGGMSSGGISPEFWREKALPLFKNRYARK